MRWLKLIAYGVIVSGLYGALFTYEKEVIDICRRGGWWFLFPVGVAFVFSIFHGNFTSLFWDVLGVQARKSR